MAKDNRTIIDEELIVPEMDSSTVTNSINQWLVEKQFIEINQVNPSTISAKQRIHDGGEGLHWRHHYKNVLISILGSDNNTKISLVMSYPETVSYDNKGEAMLRLFWAEYVRDLYTHLGTEMPERTRLQLFPPKYFKELKKSRQRTFIASSVLLMLLVLGLMDKYSFSMKILVLGFSEIILYYALLKR